MDGQVIDVLKPALADVISFGIIGAFNFYVAQILTPVRRGFFCDDTSIRYPHHQSTVSSDVPEYRWNSSSTGSDPLPRTERHARKQKRGPTYKLGNRKIPTTYWNTFKMICCYASGAIFCQLMTDVGKKTIGRLRPHFIDRCNPINFTTLCPTMNFTYELITNYTCTLDESVVRKSRVSFPSGHSSFSFYVAVFLVLYLQKKLKVRTLLLKPIIQFLLILLAWWVALSRVMNNKHHWSDVLAGILLGTTTAIVNTVLIHRIFSTRRTTASSNVLAIQSVNAPSTAANSPQPNERL